MTVNLIHSRGPKGRGGGVGEVRGISLTMAHTGVPLLSLRYTKGLDSNEVYERIEKSVISLCTKAKKG